MLCSQNLIIWNASYPVGHMNRYCITFRIFKMKPYEWWCDVMLWCHTQLVSSLSTLGDLSFSSASKMNDGYGMGPSLGSGLMKSKSDHRLAAQFRDQEDTYGYSGRTSPLMRRRFGERTVERYNLSHLLPILHLLNHPNTPLTQQLRPLKRCCQVIVLNSIHHE